MIVASGQLVCLDALGLPVIAPLGVSALPLFPRRVVGLRHSIDGRQSMCRRGSTTDLRFGRRRRRSQEQAERHERAEGGELVLDELGLPERQLLHDGLCFVHG